MCDMPERMVISCLVFGLEAAMEALHHRGSQALIREEAPFVQSLQAGLEISIGGWRIGLPTKIPKFPAYRLNALRTGLTRLRAR